MKNARTPEGKLRHWAAHVLSCHRKLCYATYKEAETAKENHLKRFPSTILKIYRCLACDFYHLGHDDERSEQ